MSAQQVSRFFPRFALTAPLMAVAAASLVACGGGGDTAVAAATTQDVSIDFAATLGATVLNTSDCAALNVDTLATRNGAAVKARLSDLRFYVSNVKLLKADGTAVPVTLNESAWQANASTGDTLALLDFENGTCVNGSGTGGTHTQLTGKVAAGTYTGVRFTLGVPESLNHTNPTVASTPKPIDSSVPGMAWSWQSGRKHLKIEFSPESPTTAGTYTGGVQIVNADGTQATSTTAGVTANVANTSTFVYHLGATGCTGTEAAGYTCSAPNTRDITISSFTLGSKRIALDLQALFSGNNGTQNTVGTAAGCMSAANDPQCTAMFTALDNAVNGTTVFRAID